MPLRWGIDYGNHRGWGWVHIVQSRTGDGIPIQTIKNRLAETLMHPDSVEPQSATVHRFFKVFRIRASRQSCGCRGTGAEPPTYWRVRWRVVVDFGPVPEKRDVNYRGVWTAYPDSWWGLDGTFHPRWNRGDPGP